METDARSTGATTEYDEQPDKDGAARVGNGRRGMRRLAKLDDFIQNLQSVKDLHDNVASGKLYLIHRMLIGGKLNVNSVNDDGDTAVTVALNCGQKEAFRLLLKHGADPNIRAPPKERSFGLCENSPLWKTITFGDLEWCQLLMEAGYSSEKDEEKEGWIEALRGHLASIEKKKKEEGIDLSQDPFNLTYANFFQWYDTVGRRIPLSLAHSCRWSIRQRLLQNSGGCSIYAAIEVGLADELPRLLRNFLLLQDDSEGEAWLEDYKRNKAKAFEKMFVFVDENMQAQRMGVDGGGGGGGAGVGLMVAHG